MKVLITGVTGFVGSHLAEFCQNLGNVEVVGTYRWRSPKQNIAHIKDLELVEMDILDATSCRQTLAAVEPDFPEFPWPAGEVVDVVVDGVVVVVGDVVVVVEPLGPCPGVAAGPVVVVMPAVPGVVGLAGAGFVVVVAAEGAAAPCGG